MVVFANDKSILTGGIKKIAMKLIERANVKWKCWTASTQSN